LKPTLIIGEPGGMQWTEYEFGPYALTLVARPECSTLAQTVAPWRWKWKTLTPPSHICARTRKVPRRANAHTCLPHGDVFDPDGNTWHSQAEGEIS